MSCCRCNRNGTCSGCICRRSGKICDNCLPGRLGRCQNRNQPSPKDGPNEEPDEEHTEEPTEEPAPECNFQWGPLDGPDVYRIISEAYNEIIHWRPNFFQVPSGNSGKALVTEIARLYQAYANDSSLESIAIKASFVCQALLLQTPSSRSKAKDHCQHLQRRLQLWNAIFTP